jgi:hypothetical protein
MILSKREQRLAANNGWLCIWKEIDYAFAKTGLLGTV